MLRMCFRSTRPLSLGATLVTRRTQWLSAQQVLAASSPKRLYADSKQQHSTTKASNHDSDAVVLPGSASATASGPTPAPPGAVNPSTAGTPSPASPSSTTEIPPQNVPLMPPSPPGGKIQKAPPTSITNRDPSSTSSSPPPPPPPRRRPRRFRKFLIYLTLLTGFGYGGAVYYSLVSDNFHDFFTEYVPFGEEAVLYFEERQFRQRFPAPPGRTSAQTRNTGNKVTIPSKSGMSWKIADADGGHATGDQPGNGRHVSASKEEKTGREEAKAHHTEASVTEKVNVKSANKDGASSGAVEPSTTGTKSKSRPQETEKNKPEPTKDDSEGAKPLVAIDPLKIQDAEEPLVQDLVKILNNIITVVNADNTSGRFSHTVESAKSELARVGSKINALKNAEKQAAEDKIKSSHAEFDRAAKELVQRLENEMHDQESRWKEEFQTEKEKITESYQQRLKTELERSKEVSDQSLRNHLLEQAIEMKRKFTSDVKDRVEQERNSRLGKLSDLSSSVSELEKLTADWNSVVDANLKTQHLQVAVEAVRSKIENADQPHPFVRELAALKEIASDNTTVNAAIASINPTAYQRGVPTSAHLIDRFRGMADEVRKASLLPEDAGVASHAASFILSKFLFKKQGLASGDDVESVLTRTETLLEEGDFDGAAREMNGLTGWAKTLSKDWLGEVRRVLEVQQALEVISTEARLQSLRVD
ncbi:MAG: Formation of crista junctions protein 1 [Sclerophora amabilis]|nr:MAG: Formation of crista junctions protein 1 [Sclerophora amabilis]